MARVHVYQTPDELEGEARRIAEKIVDTRKALDGPFSVWMHAPEWAERVAHLGTMIRWEGTLELRTRTLAALVVGRHFQAQYVWGIQGVIAEERGVPRATVDAIRDEHSDGIAPEDLQIIDFTRQLLRNNRKTSSSPTNDTTMVGKPFVRRWSSHRCRRISFSSSQPFLSCSFS